MAVTDSKGNFVETKSRPERWNEAVSKIQSAVEVLRELGEEYQDWKDNLEGSGSDGLMENATYDKLMEVEDLAVEDKVEQIVELVADFDGFDLPKGFGRD